MARAQFVTPYERRRIMILYKRGIKRTEIARIIGLHYRTVWRIVKEEQQKEAAADENS